MRSIDHMRQHKNYFAQFVDVLPGGATRRQPKRKSAKGYSTPSDSSLPSPEDVEKAIEQHITRMAQGGTYGDNMEIVAFARAYNVNVMIWQQNHRYQVDASSDPARSNATLHIAYHVSGLGIILQQELQLTFRRNGNITPPFATSMGLIRGSQRSSSNKPHPTSRQKPRLILQMLQPLLNGKSTTLRRL